MADGLAAKPPASPRDAINAALLAAHAEHDRSALIRCYAEAADLVAEQDFDAAAFYLTHAYVFALEAGDPRAAALRARLVAAGRES
ncbi:MAG: hypothetical protein AAFR16_03365 [Pseudomonadota bacterium]